MKVARLTLRAAVAALAFSVLAVGLLSGARAYLTTVQGVVDPRHRVSDVVSVAR